MCSCHWDVPTELNMHRETFPNQSESYWQKKNKNKKKRVIHLSWSQKTNSILQFFVPVFPRITANSLISALPRVSALPPSKRLPLPHFPKYRYIKITLQFSEQIQFPRKSNPRSQFFIMYSTFFSLHGTHHEKYSDTFIFRPGFLYQRIRDKK